MGSNISEWDFFILLFYCAYLKIRLHVVLLDMIKELKYGNMTIFILNKTR